MQSVPLARRSALCCGLGDSIRRWTQLPVLRPGKTECVPGRTQSDSLRCGDRGAAAPFKIIPCKPIQRDCPASFALMARAPWT